eukprot:9503810-Pyramimonas_sp.AAC.2
MISRRPSTRDHLSPASLFSRPTGQRRQSLLLGRASDVRPLSFRGPLRPVRVIWCMCNVGYEVCLRGVSTVPVATTPNQTM